MYNMYLINALCMGRLMLRNHEWALGSGSALSLLPKILLQRGEYGLVAMT